MAAAKSLKCACPKCTCTVTPKLSVKKNGELYCSVACATGHIDKTGCNNSRCKCHL